MQMRQDQTADATDRPFNNLLRRLNAADYALLAPHLTDDEARAGDLLYNPGDNVQTVHFPCGPALVGRSYASRVIQTFKAQGVLDTRRGAILVREPDVLRRHACLCNEAVKSHFEEVLRGVYPDPEKDN